LENDNITKGVPVGNWVFTDFSFYLSFKNLSAALHPDLELVPVYARKFIFILDQVFVVIFA
jgi:hypothetical protein